MANRDEIEAHYDTLGALHSLRMETVQGQYPDYTCAFYDGNYKKSYAQAQTDKYNWIFTNLKLGSDLKGKKVLDIGCGWGPILNAVRERGGTAVGLTLSPNQVAQCTKNGLDARLKDYKKLTPNELNGLDAIISIGAFEHFCSVEEKLAGKQEEVYKEFFKICAKRLPKCGHLFLQTMTWGNESPDPKKSTLDAPRDSAEAILARMEYLYPGSWLPDGLEQIVKCAKPYFDFEMHNNGRQDYLATLRAWTASTRNLLRLSAIPRALRRAIPLFWHVLTNRNARIQCMSIWYGDQTSCFAREIMSHERMFFVKK